VVVNEGATRILAVLDYHANGKRNEGGSGSSFNLEKEGNRVKVKKEMGRVRGKQRGKQKEKRGNQKMVK